MNWYTIDKEYVRYLKSFDINVPNVEYGTNKMKCFLGIVTSINDFNYFIPLSSPKKKYLDMKPKIDCYKIINKEVNKLYGVLNINNMIPVPNDFYEKINLDNLEDFRSFNNSREKKQYWFLLNKELNLIDFNLISKNAKKLHKMVTKNPFGDLAKRCSCFMVLEEKCKEYDLELSNQQEKRKSR